MDMDKNNFKFDNNDVLIIKKNGTILTKEAIDEDNPWILNSWNRKEQKYEERTTLEVGYYDENMFYDCKEFQIVSGFLDKVRYAYACMHNDTLCNIIIKKHFSNIKEIEVPSKRYTDKYYLQYWMEKYGFTLEEFLFNTKYIVLSCSNYGEFNKLLNLGLLNFDEIEICSEIDEDEDEDEDEECEGDDCSDFDN